VCAPQYYQDNERPKYLWVKPLAKDALERLRDPSRLLPGEDPKARALGVMPYLLSIDGKVIASNLATIVSLVDASDGSPVAQAAASGNGQE
jgi:hypothetical protein